MHSPREHFHTYLQSLDVDRGGLPEAFRARLGRVLAHYGVDRPRRARPQLRGGGLPRSSWPSSARPRTSPSSPRCCSSWLRRAGARTPSSPTQVARGAGPAGARHPAALPGRRRPRPQRPVPLVRPAAGGRRARPTCSPASATSVATSRADPDGRDRAAADRRAGRDPRADRAASSPSGSSTASPSASRCSRCWPGGTTASTSCTTCARSTVRRPAVRRRRLHPRRPARPTWSRPSAPSPSWPTRRAGGLVASVDRAGRRPRRRARGGRRPLPVLAGRAGSRRTRPSARLRELLGRGPVRARGCAACAVAVCPGGDRPVVLLHLPARAGRRSSRTTSCAACTRWSAAG